MRQTEQEIRKALAPVADDLARANAGFKPAEGAQSVADQELRFLRVLSVGTPDVTDVEFLAFNGGFFGLSKKQKLNAVGIFQHSYELMQTRNARLGVAGKRAEQLHQVLHGLAQIAIHGSTSQVKAVLDSFRFGPTGEGAATVNNVKAVVRSQVDAMMHDAQVSFTDSKKVTHSIGGYNERLEAVEAQMEKLRTMRKPMNTLRNGLYKAFTKADRSYLGDKRATPKDVTAYQAIMSSDDDDMVVIQEALAERGYTLTPTS
tara:strand:+ start:8571 stop:9350 length:780 start_codon:yes stop_codon:yes gene_type:complete